MSANECNLIVNYLPAELDSTQLKNLFAEHGEVCRAKVVREKGTGRSRAYGFVEFANPEDAASAIKAKNGLEISNKKLKVAVARPQKDPNSPHCKLFASNLPFSYSESDVYNMFAPFGEIMECRLLMHADSSRSKGKAFVIYNTVEECDAAVTKLNFTIPEGGCLPLQVRFAEPAKLLSHSESLLSTVSDDESECSPSPDLVTGNGVISHTSSNISAGSAGITMPGDPMLVLQHPPTFTTPHPFPTTPSAAALPQMSRFAHPHPGASYPSNTLRVYVFRLWSLPYYTTVVHIYDIFSPFGFVSGVVLDSSVQANGFTCRGTGRVDMYGPRHMRDNVLAYLNGAVVFLGEPPLQIVSIE
mmetsp:Transcript_10076/g.15267  ORF Transcript_10076/g.15267 Transcript_10076/m.15267 type:complete len:358 (+) Transcript_10076:207-1280(+)|eukprot:CAMPEP_0185018176 /NCGR_PEP_ID=MMETSP1103-20130426/986_1 /TAXON_ID=36769 /ORGANISM="Paraphysomonas bandaiensis, Strain Caron Lab Isolate" /LENGTH=357 /DNA_ID=CAMNT_0027547897 /DNA_START=77 /DNA_END=1150 /DNA_ORIENTATION=-